MRRLVPIEYKNISRLLRTIRGLRGVAYCIGGIITEGTTMRDLDIAVTDLRDIKVLKKALAKYAKVAHFMWQGGAPPAPMYLVLTGKEPKSPDLIKLKKGQRVPRNEYASP